MRWGEVRSRDDFCITRDEVNKAIEIHSRYLEAEGAIGKER